MSDTMTGAELRARLHRLGMSVPALAKLKGWDKRTLERQVTGVAPVTSRTAEAIVELEQMADQQLDLWSETVAAGAPIAIPRLNAMQMPNGFPPHWYLALAGRFLDRDAEARVVWDDEVEWA